MGFIDAVTEGTHAKHSVVIFAWLYHLYLSKTCTRLYKIKYIRKRYPMCNYTKKDTPLLAGTSWVQNNVPELLKPTPPEAHVKIWTDPRVSTTQTDLRTMQVGPGSCHCSMSFCSNLLFGVPVENLTGTQYF